MNVLIVGANFSNKGAQSMLFIAVDELKKRFPESKVYFGRVESFDHQLYQFDEIYYSKESKEIALNRIKSFSTVSRVTKDCVKTLLGRRNNTWRIFALKKRIKDIDLIIDISGFNLGEKWDIYTHEEYLKNIKLAKKYHIPMILMPQSFGPFNYTKEKAYLIEQMRELLKYPKLIFAREQEGYDYLIQTFDLKNVRLSTDLVLQNAGVDLKNIYRAIPEKRVPCLNTENNVGIVPNFQCIRHGNKEMMLDLYISVINKLIEKGKHVYIFRHSREDLDVCKMIKNAFANTESVILLEQDFNCFEYDDFVKQFQYIICSRYHGIVHAYRNYVPAILLGWAIKYEELACNVGQREYAFDITDKAFNKNLVLNAIDSMDENIESNVATISDNVQRIQKDNCFDYITE